MALTKHEESRFTVGPLPDFVGLQAILKSRHSILLVLIYVFSLPRLKLNLILGNVTWLYFDAISFSFNICHGIIRILVRS